MRDQTQPGAIPLRPLTTGEVLDAAVVLLRTHASRLLGIGFLLALVEQAVLFPLRRLVDLDDRLLPATGTLGVFGILVVIGFGTEVLCIALLGGVAATHAPRALFGASADQGTKAGTGAGASVRRPVRLGSVLVVGLVTAIACAGAGWGFLVFPVRLQVLGLVLAIVVTPLLWPVTYGLLGLSAPAVVIDQLHPVRAIGRSLRLATRTGLRGMWIRVLGYTVWMLIRIGLALATLAIIALVYSSPSTTMDNVLLGIAWLVVNGLAYPVLGCLDVALHLEIRMRTEGLDIALRRALCRGVAVDAALAVPVGRAS